MVAVPVETSLRAVVIATAKTKVARAVKSEAKPWQIRLRIMGDISLYQNLYKAVFPPSALPEECPPRRTFRRDLPV